jgi:hypothetical protein
VEKTNPYKKRHEKDIGITTQKETIAGFGFSIGCARVA